MIVDNYIGLLINLTTTINRGFFNSAPLLELTPTLLDAIINETVVGTSSATY